MEKGKWLERVLDGYADKSCSSVSIATIATSSAQPSPEFFASSSSSSGAVRPGYIEHHVSKMDTLAGVAIKYGVEVMDIKKINNLATDLQLYAHKTIQIPLPGRHPPSSTISNGSAGISDGNCISEKTPPRRPHDEILDSIQSVKLNLKPPRHKASSALSALQEYYGLIPGKRYPQHEGTEMTSRRMASDPLYMEGPNSEPILNRHRKSRSAMDDEFGEVSEHKGTTDNSDTERSIRHRQKADCGSFSGRNVDVERKVLTLKPKSAGRADLNKSHQNLIAMEESPISAGLQAIRKSSSTSDLIVTDISSSLWPTSKWNLKPDSFGLSILDNLPLPISSWRNKAARD